MIYSQTHEKLSAAIDQYMFAFCKYSFNTEVKLKIYSMNDIIHAERKLCEKHITVGDFQ